MTDKNTYRPVFEPQLQVADPGATPPEPVSAVPVTSPQPPSEEIVPATPVAPAKRCTTFSLPTDLNDRLDALCIRLQGLEQYAGWTKSSLVAEAITRQLKALEQEHGPLPAADRPLPRGRRPGARARAITLRKISVMMAPVLNERLKGAVVLLRQKGQDTTKNQLVEQAVRTLLRSIHLSLRFEWA